MTPKSAHQSCPVARRGRVPIAEASHTHVQYNVMELEEAKPEEDSKRNAEDVCEVATAPGPQP